MTRTSPAVRRELRRFRRLCLRLSVEVAAQIVQTRYVRRVSRGARIRAMWRGGGQ